MRDTSGPAAPAASSFTRGIAVARRAAGQRLALDGVAPLLVLLFVAAILRFALLGTRELFRDEAASWLLSQASWSEILPRASAEPYAPVFDFALKAWTSILGDGEAALRALSAVAGVALVGVTWVWARASIGSHVAILAAGLVTVAPLAISNAREARMYALEALLATVAWWLIWRLLTDRRPMARRRIPILLAALAVGGELWMLPTGVGAFVMQASVVGIMLLRAPHAGSRAASAALIGGLATFAPWIPRLMAAADAGRPFWTPTPNLGDLPETFAVAFTGQAPSPAWIAALPLAGLAGVGLWALFRARSIRDNSDQLATALAICGGAGLILLWWTISQWRSAYDSRYLGAAVPPLAMAIAVGWERLAMRPKGARGASADRVLTATLVVLIGIGTFVFEATWINGTGLAPGRAAALALSQRVRAGDFVLVADARSYFPVAYLVGRKSDPITLPAPVRYWRSGSEAPFSGGDLVPPDRPGARRRSRGRRPGR
ncbi:MAG: glycosyltransferase family 39 protein, partial [Chloroflexota bacterium]